MKTDYAAHDTRYLQLRAEGAPGWDSVEVSCERELGWALEGLELAHVKRVLELVVEQETTRGGWWHEASRSPGSTFRRPRLPGRTNARWWAHNSWSVMSLPVSRVSTI